jgi:hypothetical protein
MKKTIRLTESELINLIKQAINEDMFDNGLEYEIKDLIRNSNTSNEEAISILRNIADEMESSRRVRRDAGSRFRDEM